MGIKKYKLVSFGICFLMMNMFVEVMMDKLEKSLFVLMKSKGGCNNQGCMIFCYCGGGYKCCYCIIDFKCDKDGMKVIVKMIECDLNCSVYIVLLEYIDGEKCYIIVFNGLQVGFEVVFGEFVVLVMGNMFYFKDIFLGLIIYVIEFCLSYGVVMVRFVGIYCILMGCEGKYVVVKFFFGEVCCVLFFCKVIIGIIFNFDYNFMIDGKVGWSCWKGCCLCICGVVMNFVDYFMGGGEGCVLGGYLCFCNGQLVKGKKMWKFKKYFNKFIITKCKLGKCC